MDRRYNAPSSSRSYYNSSPPPPPYSYPPNPDPRASTPSPPPPPSQQSTMASFFNSPKTQLIGTALLSGAVVAGGIFGYQAVRRQERVEDLKSSIPQLGKEEYENAKWKGRLMGEVKLTDYGAASNGNIKKEGEKEGKANGDIGVPREKLSKEDEKAVELAERAQRGDYDDELILEQLARNRVFLTDEGLKKLRTAFVIVVGCGGVGSHCTAALARSGVSRIRLIDFDQVTLSSLNRHAVATLADVGTSKVHCLRRRLQQITPWVHFDLRNELFAPSAADTLLGPWEGRNPDYIVDAIDNIDSKVALLEYCHKNNLPVISSMGAGCKSDPTRIFIGDISASTEDPLSRSTRRRLRALGVASGIPVVYSTEKPGEGKAQLLPLPEEEFAKGSVGDLGVLPEFRVRILPVLGTMPAIFGYTCANFVILKIAGYPCEYVPAKGREKMYDGILAQLQGSEEKLARATTPGDDAQGLKLGISVGDVGYLVEEVFRGKSVLSGVGTRLALVRWRAPPGGSTMVRGEGQKTSMVRLRELVCVTKEEAVVHEREVIRGSKTPEELYGKEVVDAVEARIREEIGYGKYR